MQREYIVTLKSKNDLISFYSDMETSGGSQHIPDREVELKERRAISRNTHYLLTDEEAEELRKDDRVLVVELTPKERGLETVLFSSYNVSGNFDKTPEVFSNDINLGILHCAGNQSQRRKGFFGIDMAHQFSDTVTIFNDGENVDVVIVDEPVAYDHQEFLDPQTNQSRFIQYQWYSELDQYMILLDTQESNANYQNFISNNTDLPYYNCSELHGYELSHGTHVAGIATGKIQGWARKSNIYSIAVNTGKVVEEIGQQNSMEDAKIFDYLRAFHLNKSINPTTGKINPTVTNHSWGYSYSIEISNLSSITSVKFRGQSISNPGWTISDLGSNFGIYVKFEDGVYKLNIPAKVSSLEADVQDAIEDGVIVVTAAGNSNYYGVPNGHQDYNNTITITGEGTIHYNRGSSPGATLDAINVGNISAYSDFRRHESSNFGPIVNVFAPGTNIISAFPNSTTYYFPQTGTSMAAPQVAGIVACFCTDRDGREVNNARALQYLQDMGINEEITEDVNGGSLSDNTTLRDSPNLTATSRERRDEYSLLSFNDFPRENEGVIYPRKKIGKKS